MRTQAREAVLKILYAEIIDPIDAKNAEKGVLSQLQTDTRKGADILSDEVAYAVRLLETIEAHKDAIVRKIDENILNFKEDRLYPVDRAVLMIAVAEILYFDDVPSVVSASEATDIAQKYSTETSADFVNGVLAGVISNV